METEDLDQNSRPPRDETGLLPGTDEYRRARKRRQNRESTARAKARKEIELSQTMTDLAVFQQQYRALTAENSLLQSENEALKAQVDDLQSRIERNESTTFPN